MMKIKLENATGKEIIENGFDMETWYSVIADDYRIDMIVDEKDGTMIVMVEDIEDNEEIFNKEYKMETSAIKKFAKFVENLIY